MVPDSAEAVLVDKEVSVWDCVEGRVLAQQRAILVAYLIDAAQVRQIRNFFGRRYGQGCPPSQ